MAEGRQTVLPDGEFFTLSDERDDFHTLAGRTIRVPGEDPDGGLYDQHDRYEVESKKLGMARLRKKHELNPDRDPSWRMNYPSLFDDRRFPFDPRLLLPTSYFYGPAPRHAIHYDLLTDFATEPSPGPRGTLHESSGSYLFVSREWMDAIESLEPDVHEFFPHIADFSDHVMHDHFIFRDRAAFDFVDFEKSDPETAVEWLVFENKGGYHLRFRPTGIAAKRELLEGCHWARQRECEWAFVSRALALKLLPLLPDTIEPPNAIRFTPVELV